MSKKDEKRIKKDRSYSTMQMFRTNALTKEFYSYQRIDLLIISLSTGGILVLLSVFGNKDINLDTCSKVLLFICLVLFVLAIFSNIFSQVFAAKANRENAEWSLNELEIINDQTDESEEYNVDKTSSNWTTYLNASSMIFLVLSILLTLIASSIIIF